MTTTTELKELMKSRAVLPIDWQIATGKTVTDESVQAAQKAQRYQNREKMPEGYLWMADLYNELTGQEPTKRVFMDWMSTFEDWKQEGLLPEHIRAAWMESNNEKGGFFVGRPGALTVVAVSMKSKMIKPKGVAIDQQAVNQTKQLISEKYDDKKFVPRPANCPRPNIGGSK